MKSVLFARALGFRFTLFDKFCAGAAALLGVVLVALGLLGLIFGCRLWFTLPPLLGALPAFVGYGIVRCVYLAWQLTPGAQDPVGETLAPPPAP